MSINVQDLIQSIESFCSRSAELRSKYTKILDQYTKGNKSPSILLQELFELVKPSPQALATLSKAIGTALDQSPIDLIGFFLYQTKKNILIQRYTALYIFGLLPYSYFRYLTEQVISKIPLPERPTLFPPPTLDLGPTRRQVLSKFDFHISPDINPSVFLQLISMISCNMSAFDSFLRCFTLFSFKIITISKLKEWMSIIFPWFELCNLDLMQRPDLYHPSSMFNTISKEVPTDFLKWAITEPVYTKLSKIRPPPGPTIFDIIEAKRISESFLTKAFSKEVCRLKSMQYYEAIVSIINGIQEGSPCEINYSTIISLFGNNETNQSVLISQCLSQGTKEFSTYKGMIQQEMKQLSPSSYDCRFLYFELLQANNVFRDILFNGITISRPSKNTALQILATFVNKYQRLRDLMAIFSNAVLSDGRYELDEDGALAVYYYLEIVRICSLCTKKIDPKGIVELAINESPPFPEYQDEEMSNFDIPLQRAASALNRIHKENTIEQFNAGDSFISTTTFTFCMKIDSKTISLRGAPNPISVD